MNGYLSYLRSYTCKSARLRHKKGYGEEIVLFCEIYT
jgi:hypothetical protein